MMSGDRTYLPYLHLQSYAAEGFSEARKQKPNGVHWEVYRNKKNEWRWRLRAANNKVIASSGEGYINHKDMVKAMKLVAGVDENTPVRERGRH
jgi:hypothetical protein